MREAIFFDLDGTLWDATYSLCDSYNQTMNNLGLKYHFTHEMVVSYMGLTSKETALLAFKDLKLEDGLKLFNKCVQDEIVYLKSKPSKLFDGEIEVLQNLSKNYDLFLVSNCEKGYIENYLNTFNLNSLFKDHLCAGDTGFDKANNLMLLCKKYGFSRFFYVGDTYKDMVETKKAGGIFIHASYGFGKIDEKVNYIKSIQQLPDIVSNLLKK